MGTLTWDIKVYPLTLWFLHQVTRQRPSHVHAHIERHRRCHYLKDVGRSQRVHLRVHHGVNGQDVCQGNLFVVLRGGVWFVECETLGVQPPVVLLTLCVCVCEGVCEWVCEGVWWQNITITQSLEHYLQSARMIVNVNILTKLVCVCVRVHGLL